MQMGSGYSFDIGGYRLGAFRLIHERTLDP